MNRDVLLVDVTPTVRFAIRVALEGSAFTVLKEAQTDAEGQHYFESERPSVVAFDMTLSLHQRLRALRHFSKRFPTSRVVAIYSRTSRPNLAGARRAGAKELIAFPFNKESLLAALDRLVGTPHPPGSGSPAEPEP